TYGDYQAFLNDTDSGKKVCGQIDECTWNTSYAGSVTPPPDSGSGLTWPVVGIDWCDAYMYCQWAGKSLCASISGGTSTNRPDPASGGPSQALCATSGSAYDDTSSPKCTYFARLTRASKLGTIGFRCCAS